MNIAQLTVAKNIDDKFKQLKQQENFPELAKLIAYAFQVNSKESNQQIFGYIPKIFREVAIFLDNHQIQSQDIFLGEPVVYKIYYPNQQKLYDLSYFYIFCYLKENSTKLNIYFQSAHPKYRKLCPDDYKVEREIVNFEGCISAFSNDNISVISISDPGQFIPGFTSSFYVGSAQFNFVRLIAQVLENIIDLSDISNKDTLLFGSSAGTFGALLTSTYFHQKVNVLAVNSQIKLQYRKEIMKTFFGRDKPQEIIKHFGEQVSCLYRFQQELNSVPNIYILANINDNLYQRNFDFYQQYLQRYTKPGVNNQSVFDSYYGVDGHGRPESTSLKAKIRIAREILTIKSRVE